MGHTNKFPRRWNKMTYYNPLVFDLSTEGLEPIKHRIIGITLKSIKEEQVITHRDEKQLLTEFWKYVKSGMFDVLIGFNSDNFDMPMLLIRSIKHSVPIVKMESVDVREKIFGNKEKAKGKLGDFKNLLGITYPNHGYDKMHMSLLWEEPTLEELKETLLEDVKTTWELYGRIKEAGFI